ncbi:MAG: hypothetical protein M3Q39_04885 [Actinomycetota bacterium]|nr:hypothetical protein [Actinomycetota bacterium]
MVDLHSHIQPGFDDGAPDLEASVDIARAAVRDGTRCIVATPHVSLSYDGPRARSRPVWRWCGVPWPSATSTST